MAEFADFLTKPPPGDEVVITGISGRFPESNNVSEFGANLFNKKDMVTDDDRRWKVEHPEIPQRTAKIYDIDKLDAGFFGLHYRQANTLDPMIRKFLEVAVEAIMDAGLNPSELEGSKTGVFVGSCRSDTMSGTLATITEPQKFVVTGYLTSMFAHRLSYFLKLKGPSFILDSACSGSSNAINMGFNSIRQGQCDMAIVAGASLLGHPFINQQFYRLGVLSPDGTCKVFDEEADGYARGETVACVLLQKAKNAKRIYGHIVYSKVNNDGFKPSGITFPSAEMQGQLINEVLEGARIHPSEIDFLEAHATGTRVGDPEEVSAIDCAIAKKRDEPLLIGSVKSSIGHTEPSSGIASLAKVIIAMETGNIPPNIHLKKIRTGLEGFHEGRMIPVTETTKLFKEEALIGVNNFGFGGNNCHFILKRFKNTKMRLARKDFPRLVCVSGRTKEAVLHLLQFLNTKPIDDEHVGLLHQIYKTNISGHLFRGFAVLSEKGKSQIDVRFFPQKQTLFFVFFGHFENGCSVLETVLMRFSPFRRRMEEINQLFAKHNCKIKGFALQIGIVDILGLLDLKPAAIYYGNSFGKLVADYYYGTIQLEEAVEIIARQKLDTKQTNDFPAHVGANSIVLNISDTSILPGNELLLIRNGEPVFLETLGRLYQEGHNSQLHKLFPRVEYPVSRNTPMIAPLIKWDYHKSWYTYKYGPSPSDSVAQMEHSIAATIKEGQKFLEGHVIDGRNLIAATQYLQLVWSTLIQQLKTVNNTMPVVFENCTFIRALTVPKKGVLSLLVSIQKGSGLFEISEKESLVVTGRVTIPEDVTQYETSLPDLPFNEDDPGEILTNDEIYRELYLRGYNYSGLFKGIVKCNVDASVALIRWDNNWTTFTDTMLQLKILQIDTRLLYVPVKIQKLVINPNKVVLTADGSLCRVYSYKNCNVIKCASVEISGIKATSITRRKPHSSPVLEKYVFVPYSTRMTLKESVRVNTQVILENSLESNFRAVEILDDDEHQELILPSVRDALDDLPSVILNLTVSTKTELEEIPGVKIENFVLTPTSNLLLVITTKIFQRPKLFKEATGALSDKGYILTREEKDFTNENPEMEILTEHVVNDEKLILCRKTQAKSEKKCIEVSAESFNWLPDLQNALKHQQNIVIYCQNQKPDGVLGLVNCIRREPGGSKVSCFFVMDEAPKFDPEHPFYVKQIAKNLAFNVYKDTKWGSYRHLHLSESVEVTGQHFYVNTLVKSDLSSLKWIEGPLNPQTKTDGTEIAVFPYYSAVNFKDIMAASGRVNVDALTSNRFDQECLVGFEFSGVDINGRRVAGMSKNMSLSNIVYAEKNGFLWEVPDEVTLEEAGTLIVVYITVIYSLLWISKIKPGKSILIHSATGGIGLAAINVCLYHGCEIYVTVGTKEKRDYLLKHFPEIPESHIGNSRDTSFEEMIKRETNGRGVDFALNSLSEEKLRATVRCIAQGGDFLEIGKFDMGIDSALSLLLMERNISYHGIMIDRITDATLDVKYKILDKFREGYQLGYVKPLPSTVFEKDEVEKAFRYMMTGNHIGKVLVRIRNEDKPDEIFKGAPRFFCDPEKTYIIVGGLGGFGLELADWLYLRHAKKLILVSRSGIQNGYQKQRVSIWESSGVTVKVSTKDVTTMAGCSDLIEEAGKLGPVDAIFNLAVVLKDALFEDQSQESFNTSFAPKAQATTFLDQVSRRCCPYLRYFVVFSSVSCGRGNPGQTNYGMANSIMERICEERKRDGLPGLAIQWGAIGEVGLVAKMQKENKELVIGGTLQQKVSSCLEALDKFLKQDHPVVASMVVAEKDSKLYGSGSAVDAVAHILGIKDIKTVSPHSTFAELGMDSMTGNEMLQILEREYEIYITPKDARNMTFAKLTQLESELKENANAGVKVAIGVNTLLQFMPKLGDDNSLLIKLESKVTDDDKAKTVFVLPGIEASLESLEPLTKNLNARVFGIRYRDQNPEDSVEECCKNILQHIEEIVKNEGSFQIIGYSFGSFVATELVALLEEEGYRGTFIAIDGSPEYILAATRDHLPATTDGEFETLILFKLMAMLLPTELLSLNKDRFKKCESLNDRIELGRTLIPPNTPRKEDFRKECVVALCKRFKYIFNYKFNHKKIESAVHLFKAKTPLVDCTTDYNLSELCEKPISITTLEGNHSTIISQMQLAETVNLIACS